MSRTILLADDSLTIQKVVELTFADTDYDVVAVSSGDELLLKLPDCSPDIVICDVIMPGRDGYDVCQEIKSSPGSLHLPVILLTGTFEPFDRDRALAAGCSEIITKPFEAKKLVEAVENLAAAPGFEEYPESVAAMDLEHHEPSTPAPAIPAAEEAVEHDFGTHFAESPDAMEHQADDHTAEAGEELEFTDSGFAEMEEAGREQAETAFDTPEEGIEFEFGAESDIPEEELTDPIEEMSSADSGPFPEPLPEAQTEFTIGDDAEETDVGEGSPFADIEETDSGPPAGFGEELEGEPETVLEEIEELDEIEELPPESEVYDDRMTAPIETVQALGAEEKGWKEVVPESVDGPPSDQATEIDTQDLAEEVAELTEIGSESLSDEDVDRIAHRLLELAGDRIEQIAWDVIPDMAELVVRERVREIEEEAGSTQPEETPH